MLKFIKSIMNEYKINLKNSLMELGKKPKFNHKDLSHVGEQLFSFLFQGLYVYSLCPT
jgi:hypothetical protein